MASPTRRRMSPTAQPNNAVIDEFLQDAVSYVTFVLNGDEITIDDPDPTETLNEYLRRPEVACMGTKWACKEGGCGACTVMVSRYDPIVERTAHFAIDSCLLPICSLDGVAIATTEGIGSTRTTLDPVQDKIASDNGSQCGYCTPGFVMNMYSMLQENPKLTEQQIEDRFAGNICRCTGYRAILHAMRSFADDAREREQVSAMVIRASKNGPQPVQTLPLPENQRPFRNNPTRKAGDYSTPESINAFLKEHSQPRKLYFEANGYQWFKPTTLDQLYDLRQQYGTDPNVVRLVVGNTSTGVYKKDVEDPHILIDIAGIPDLNFVTNSENGPISVGAAVTLERLIDILERVIPFRPAQQTGSFTALLEHLRKIAGTQVRSAGSLAGNLMMCWNHQSQGSPFASDFSTVLVGIWAMITVGSRTYSGGSNTFYPWEFFGQTSLPDDFVILSFWLPTTYPSEYVRTYKVARRNQNAHAIVNAAVHVTLDPSTNLTSGTIVYGGIGRVPFIASQTLGLWQYAPLNEATLARLLPVLRAEIQAAIIPHSDGISNDYRVSLALTLFYKAFVSIALEAAPNEVSPQNKAAGLPFNRPLSSGEQHYEVYPEEFPVSEPLVKLSAYSQASGEAVYTQDLPSPPGTLYGAYVQSASPSATFNFNYNGKSLAEFLPALRATTPDLSDFVTAADVPVPAKNACGLGGDDYIFAAGTTSYVGQSLGLVVATSQEVAETVAAFIQSKSVQYAPTPPVFGIDQAIQKGSIYQNNPPSSPFLEHINLIERPGSNDTWLNNPSVPPAGCQVISGTQRTGAQIHFYMETFNALAVPTEETTLELWCSTQDAGSVQAAAAAALGVPYSSVIVHVPLVGGGYGAKETRPPMVAAAAAVAAWKTKRPVRITLERQADSLMIGKRHPYRGDFYAAYQPDGTIVGTRTQFYSDGGSSYDVSFPVMDLTQLSADNAYLTPTFRSDGSVCKTNIASSTAFRSFGVIQGTLIQEEMIERVAYALGMAPEDVRFKNLYQNGSTTQYDTTPYGQKLIDCNIRDVWAQLMTSSDFANRRQEVAAFNAANRWRKRGISMIPLKYGIAYTASLLDQGNALVTAYAGDGSVIVQHGGIEIGQGVHTKMAQIAALKLGIPMSLVRIGPSLTSAVGNASSTGGSTAADLNGGAVANACANLRATLVSFLESQSEQWLQQNGVADWRTNWANDWTKIVGLGYVYRIDLTAHGYFAMPGLIDVTNANPQGSPFFYFNYCAAASEVEIDVLTGEFEIRRTDILYDAGKSLNPLLDIGQVEGAFIQGVGNLTTEQVVYEDDGTLFTYGTWDYKPPCSKTIPVDFRVTLLSSPKRNAQTGELIDPAGIQSSKSTGEPPLVLSATVFFAIKRAILEARKDQGLTGWFDLESPATVERIQAACAISAAQLQL
ncbi:MAG: molybdopterin cofactor-binding domain-containing protein [Gemmatimonadota bacterium]